MELIFLREKRKLLNSGVSEEFHKRHLDKLKLTLLEIRKLVALFKTTGIVMAEK